MPLGPAIPNYPVGLSLLVDRAHCHAMEGGITELRATADRLRPILVARPRTRRAEEPLQQHASVTDSTDSVGHGGKTPGAEPESAVLGLGYEGCGVDDEWGIAMDQRQTEAASELLKSVSVFIFQVDCHLQATMDCRDGSGDMAMNVRPESSANEPGVTAWYADSKSIVAECFDMLLQANSQKGYLACKAILKLLPSLGTSLCRHLLLEYLPAFTPCDKDAKDSRQKNVANVPPWLTKSYRMSENEASPEFASEVGSDSKNALGREDVLSKFPTERQVLKTLKSLMQVDVSTVSSFLSSASILLSKSWADENGARSKCFKMCLSKLASGSRNVSQFLIPPLTWLVRDTEEGTLAMTAIRKGFMADVTAGERRMMETLSVGRLLLRTFLQNNNSSVAGVLAAGYLGALKSALNVRQGSELFEVDSEVAVGKVTPLDAIVLVALYSREDYRRNVEDILDHMTLGQARELLESMTSLIQSWLGRESGQNSALLYEQLASPLLAVALYILLAFTSVCAASGHRATPGLIGGLPTFHVSRSTEKPPSSQTKSLTDFWCMMIVELYCAMDQQRKEALVMSLMSMLTESFVYSACKEMHSTHQHVSDVRLEKERNERLQALLLASTASCRALLHIATNAENDLSQIRGLAVDRIIAAASKSASRSTYNIGAMFVFDLNCVIAIALLSGDAQDDRSNLTSLCRKFLSPADVSDRHGQCRAIFGLVLASRLLRCPNFHKAVREDVFDRVSSAITPSVSMCPSMALAPDIAAWGLSFMNLASASLVVDFPFPREFIITKSVCGSAKVFNHVNRMLATASIIRLESSPEVPTQHSQHESGHQKQPDRKPILAFAHVETREKKRKSTPDMLICASYFLYGGSHTSLGESNKPDMMKISRYIYDVIHNYLALGRRNSAGALKPSAGHWDPRIWLQAKVQLPPSLPEKALNLLGVQKLVGSSTGDLDLGEEIQDEWKAVFDDKSTSLLEICQGLVELACSLAVSISASSAILYHAHDHFQTEKAAIEALCKNCEDSGDSLKLIRRRRKQIFSLRRFLRFQVWKVHAMEAVFKNVRNALNELSFGEDNTEENWPSEIMDTDRLRSQLSEMENLSLFERVSFDIIWTCLDDDSEDQALLDYFTWINSNNSSLPYDASMGKRSLAQYMTTLTKVHEQVLVWSDLGELDHSKESLEKIVQRLLSTILQLAPIYQNQGVEQVVDRQFGLLVEIFSLAAYRAHDHGLVSDLCKACEDKHSESDKSAVVSMGKLLSKLLRRFQDHVVSCRVIELLSILSAEADSILSILTKFTEASLGSAYKVSDGLHLPEPFLLFKISAEAEATSPDAEAGLVASSFSNLLALSASTFNARKNQHVFVHTALTHWCALTLTKGNVNRFLVEMSNALASFMTRTFVAASLEVQSRKRRDDYPGLNRQSYARFFEFLLVMACTSAALIKPTNMKKVSCPLQVFGRLLTTYHSYHDHFLQRSYLTIITSASDMLKVCENHMKSCIGRPEAELSLISSLSSKIALLCKEDALSHHRPKAAARSIISQCENVNEYIRCNSPSPQLPGSPKRKWIDSSVTNGSIKRKKKPC